MPFSYSICITSYNSQGSIRECLSSIFSQIDESFEVIVVDSMSDDGSEIFLRELANAGKLKLIKKKCSRGQGRQIALENSEGTYIIAHMDADEVFKPVLKQFLNLYHKVCDDKVLVATDSSNRWRQNITVAPKETILSLGGWRNLQFAEDWDLWSRAAQRGLYRWTKYTMIETFNNQTKVGITKKFKRRVGRYRDELRLGREIFNTNVDVKVNIFQRLALYTAKLVSFFYESYRSDFNLTFDCADKRYFVSLDGVT